MMSEKIEPPQELKMWIDPGDAPPELVARFLRALNELDRAAGGAGLDFRLGDDHVGLAISVIATSASRRAMTQKIEPALSAEEWAKADGIGDTRNWTHDKDGTVTFGVAPAFEPYREDFAGALIALLNNSLPGSDPRKITRETIVLLRETARDVSSGIEDGSAVAAAEMHADALRHLADALESYLPPLV